VVSLSNLKNLQTVLPFIRPILALSPALSAVLEGFLPSLALVIFMNQLPALLQVRQKSPESRPKSPTSPKKVICIPQKSPESRPKSPISPKKVICIPPKEMCEHKTLRSLIKRISSSTPPPLLLSSSSPPPLLLLTCSGWRCWRGRCPGSS